MKRIKYACLEQTVHFMLKEDIPHDEAVKLACSESERYLSQLEKTHAKYKIVSKETLPDGSVMLSVKKQYNNHDVGNYFE